jgi:hypothetical protein
MRGTEAAIFFQVIAKNQQFYGWFFQKQVFNTSMVIWMVISFIYLSFLKPRHVMKDSKNKEMK